MLRSPKREVLGQWYILLTYSSRCDLLEWTPFLPLKKKPTSVIIQTKKSTSLAKTLRPLHIFGLFCHDVFSLLSLFFSFCSFIFVFKVTLGAFRPLSKSNPLNTEYAHNIWKKKNQSSSPIFYQSFKNTLRSASAVGKDFMLLSLLFLCFFYPFSFLLIQIKFRSSKQFEWMVMIESQCKYQVLKTIYYWILIHKFFRCE